MINAIYFKDSIFFVEFSRTKKIVKFINLLTTANNRFIIRINIILRNGADTIERNR